MAAATTTLAQDFGLHTWAVTADRIQPLGLPDYMVKTGQDELFSIWEP